MTAGHFLLVWRAETEKLMSRLMARLGLVVSILIGVLGPFGVWWIGTSSIVFNNAPVADKITKLAPVGIEWALGAQNLFVLRAMIIMLGALVFASEYSSRTVREDALRPVPRWAIPVAKWLALSTWIGLALVLTWLFAAVLGIVIFGFSGAWTETLVAYGVRFVCDIGFAALVMAASVALRSVVGTVGGVMVFLIFDTLAGWALSGLDAVSQMMELPAPLAYLVLARPWLPSSAFGVWAGYADGNWEWQGFAALAAITVVSFVVSLEVFRRIDIP